MVELSRRIITSASTETVFKVLKNIAMFPQFISGVEKIHSAKIRDNISHNKWSIDMQGVSISWEEEETINNGTNEIRFKRIAGDFDIFEGTRGTRKTRNGSEIYVTLKIDWASNGKINSETIHKKSILALRWMLRSIRERLDAKSILKYQHVDKNNRVITSELIKYKNLCGKNIVGFFDYIESQQDTAKFIIIPAGYGETKRDALMLSYSLICNGFNIIRYDNTDHIGESDGDIFFTTMPKMKDNIIATLDYIEKRFGVHQVGIVASSLSKRVALKAAAEDSRISFFLSLVGIVNLKATLQSVYNLDIIGKVESDKEKHVNVAEILGYEVSREFPKTAIIEKYHDLESTKQDISKLKIPFVFIVAEKDEWVSLEDVKTIFESCPTEKKELFVMQDTMHLIYENPKAARSVLKQVIMSCKKYILGTRFNAVGMKEPSLREVAAQNKIEKSRLRCLVEITKEGEKEFWKSYLNKYVLITKSKDFRNLLSLIEILLGVPKKNEIILDAGCGNGHFGAWLLWGAAARYKNSSEQYKSVKRKYIGIDFVQNALNEAKVRHREIQKNIFNDIQNASCDKLFEFEYFPYDMEKSLDFPDNFFEKICCNLVISYLKNPFFTLKELMRVLKPQGRIVVTSLKPHPDLSYIYKNFIKLTSNEEESREARLLLSAAGKIKKKEGEGQYKFFSERQLKSLFLRAKAVNIKDYRAFADQAVVLVAEKSNER